MSAINPSLIPTLRELFNSCSAFWIGSTLKESVETIAAEYPAAIGKQLL